MNGNRYTLIFSLALATNLMTTSSYVNGNPPPKTRLEQSRINLLIQIIQSDPDEGKRDAAVAELSKADPRLSTGVIQILTEALLKDTSAKVRLTAIGVISRYNTIFAFTGHALETATDSDVSPEVRKAAKQALWEYHLIGYKSARELEVFPKQTAEPPLAKPAGLPRPVTAEPTIIPAAVNLQPVLPQLPSVNQTPGPRISPIAQQVGPINFLKPARPLSNVTVEPPLAQNINKSVTPPVMREPPILPHWPGPLSTGTPHKYSVDLPPLIASP